MAIESLVACQSMNKHRRRSLLLGASDHSWFPWYPELALQHHEPTILSHLLAAVVHLMMASGSHSSRRYRWEKGRVLHALTVSLSNFDTAQSIDTHLIEVPADL